MPAKSLETKRFADQHPVQAAIASAYRPTHDAAMEARIDHLETAFADAANRLTDVQCGMAETKRCVAGIDLSLAAIQQRQAVLEARTDRLEQTIDNVDRKLDDLRETNERRFDELRAHHEKRFEAIKAHQDKRLDEFRAEVDNRFKAIDKRFEAVDKRFEAVDKRFDAVDKRFNAVDERFKTIDDNFADLKLAIATLSQRMEDGFRSIHEKLEERPTRVELLRTVVVLLLAAISVGWGVGAYLLRTHGEVRAAEVIDAARGR